MYFERFPPSNQLKNLVREYWIYENDDSNTAKQKVIPDGFSEIIIHYGDAYQINLNGGWQTQSKQLFSSQISKYFFIRNTGKSGMLGIKLHPSAFYSLFQFDMSETIDQVLPLHYILDNECRQLDRLAEKNLSLDERISLAESWLNNQLPNQKPQEKINACLDKIFEKNGMIEIDSLASDIELSTRQMERMFKKVIGLTPKFYCRIIRFNYIFEVMKKHNDSWIRTALQSGYFDQSHFIKNFKEFTGEEPSSYGFDEYNLANFFLKK